MNKKFICLVLGTIDYKEKDKLLKIFTLDEGLILAKLKGVKGITSKLKILSNPFCFAEIVVNQTGNNYTVVGSEIIDSFFDIAKDYDRYFIGSVIIKTLLHFLNLKAEDYKELFYLTVESFKLLAYSEINEAFVLCRFIFKLLKLNGVGFATNKCSICGNNILNEVYIDYFSGGIKCENCIDDNSKLMEKSVFEMLKKIEETNLEDTNTINLNRKDLFSTLRLLANYLYCTMQYILPIKEYLDEFDSK